MNIPTSCPSADGQPQIGPTGKPMVKCEICAKELADPSSLYRHRKIHNGEKPHKCPYCDRRFIQRYNMVQHMKVHEKKFRRQAQMEAQAQAQANEAEIQASLLRMHAQPAPETSPPLPPPELESSHDALPHAA